MWKGFSTETHFWQILARKRLWSLFVLFLVGALSFWGKMPDCSSDFFFLQTTILTLKGPLFLQFFQSYNSYLANLKYWRKSLRSSIFTSSKKLKGTKGYFGLFSALWDFFFEKKFPQRVLLQFSWSFPTERMLKNPKGSPPFSFFGIVGLFFK